MTGIEFRAVRRRVVAAFACALLTGSTTPAGAQRGDSQAEPGAEKERRNEEQSNDPIYAGGNASVPSGKRAVLDAGDERVMRVLWQEGVWELPYSRITNLYVSLSRPSAMVELGGSLLTAPFMLGAMKNRKLYLSVSYDGLNAPSGKCIFLVRQGYGDAVELLAKRSQRNIVFETFDAKRRMNKPD
jgi:hypothetical protein